MKRLIECVPNFSEGRDAAKVDAIVAAMSQVPGVYVLDREMDRDHHRSVVTLAGEPDAVAEAALFGVGKALELIDLTKHSGAHPRIGATDVVPFIPIEGIALEDCVALARRVGEEIWKRYRIPIYFYEAAAMRPERTNLENIRRGQFEGLREEMKRDHARLPDVGEPKLHPTAGATVVGARKFLIAYNVNLNTSDVGIANKIAKAIRFSSGGLRHVKSMGVELKARNLAQVSINLTDFEQTPMHRVYEMVKREAARYGAIPVGSEIVGLIPKKAIEMAADYFLQVEDFSPAQVFENRLQAALTGQSLDPAAKQGKLAALAEPFLEAVAAPTATPGGGSVSALAGALAASLGQMVAGLSRKKKAQAAFLNQLSEALEQLRRDASELAEAIDQDAAAYESVMAAYKLPQDGAEEKRRREDAIQSAMRGAAEVPLQVAERGVALFERLGQLASIAAASMKSDLEVARLMAAAATRGALANVEINLESIVDANYVASTRAKGAALRERLGETFRSISA
ncbi:MAG TPA: glutamate formimidoyltransferase [Candidatus Saccharimonadales bacterium]|jgi:glutamate formiminotransferase/formiminotetrahydrofolate cyclodeaminase|nr:glutamate formimidoyltransferase [Candidatus Saccharimonadales bacterium]